MSGFAGIVHLDGAPVSKGLVEKMARLTERHGGDAFHVHSLDDFGFGYSQLATTQESANEQQPLSLDGSTWIVGDVRVDGRGELVESLCSAGRSVNLGQPDIQLVLHAFHAWGENCVDRLLGDYAFIVWCTRSRRVFCARDVFGVKPLYYSIRGNSFIFSNEIRAMRGHPEVTSDLNENTICDYLAFGYNHDETTTYFRDISRLPPSHSLLMEAGRSPVITRQSRLIANGRIRYADERDYVENFLDLFSTSVNDRLRTQRLGVELSGGLDSTSVAAMASRVSRGNSDFFGTGITTDNSIRDPNDEEARFAAMVCDKLGFEHQVLGTGELENFYAYCVTAQPFPSPYMAEAVRFASAMRARTRVMFSGQGGDPFTDGSGYPLLDEFREEPFFTFMKSLLYRMVKNRSPRHLGLRTLWAGSKNIFPMPPLHRWLKPEFVKRAGSIERWAHIYSRPDRFPSGCTVEQAWDEAHMTVWSHLFEDYYHEFFWGIDCRHPFFDLRLANYLLAIPVTQTRDKGILRRAMRGLLPDPVLDRPKTPIISHVMRINDDERRKIERLSISLQPLADWIDPHRYWADLNEYIGGGQGDRYTTVYPLNLALWMEQAL